MTFSCLSYCSPVSWFCCWNGSSPERKGFARNLHFAGNTRISREWNMYPDLAVGPHMAARRNGSNKTCGAVLSSPVFAPFVLDKRRTCVTSLKSSWKLSLRCLTIAGRRAEYIIRYSHDRFSHVLVVFSRYKLAKLSFQLVLDYMSYSHSFNITLLSLTCVLSVAF